MHNVREIHHAMIKMPDGIHLAYRAWLPSDSETTPVPAILEFLPYRKNDGTIVRDEITMAQTAAHGYACIRVDLRGCGESDGQSTDEYTQQELDDGVNIIAWIASQPWCNGRVGMMGISWGGFNSLQIAALNPPALKAIITICSTDDRYGNDVHYMGGCLLNDNLDWAAFFWAYAQGRAPDAKLVGEGWKEQWLERLHSMPFLAKPWLTEQTRNGYWKHGSVCEDYSSIKVPVYAMGGWADNYRRTVFSLLENLDVSCKGLIGPWAHKYPNIAYPNPKMDYVKESVRWWDRWLKEEENGVDQEPQLTYYLQDSVRPQGDYEHRPGKWLSEPCWPSPRTSYQTFYLNNRHLLKEPQPDALSEQICSPQTVGLNGGRLCVGIRLDMEQPDDQRIDDAGSLCFDSTPLSEPLSLAGDITAHLTLSSNKPKANVIVRLCDVHPDGAVTRISLGVLNLTHRNSHEFIEDLVPNELYQVQVSVNPVAYRLPEGHRLRVSISNAYWPLVWPSADQATLTIASSQCAIKIATREEVYTEVEPPHYDQEVTFNGESLRGSDSQRVVHHDYKTGVVTLETHDDFGRQHYHSSDSYIDMSMSQWQSIHPENPLSAKSSIQFDLTMGREGWLTGLKGDYQMCCDADNFYITCKWQAFHDGELIFNKEFDETIKRTGV
ncbi:CocE/NonD family hydrolase [Marinomonas sp. A79]|uniref:CocE/NonD family hydrolase n=1 Tax=Marinomonas vulgaris TaxID=2823372 RepID=A0ABS5HEZ5_9GAMM|nr:CocE/NonD family hydrolase [Marinomonas vulgaris]MBR7890029.1 CocE/NonD family hydrolase [Marinomonas vulgaris]